MGQGACHSLVLKTNWDLSFINLLFTRALLHLKLALRQSEELSLSLEETQVLQCFVVRLGRLEQTILSPHRAFVTKAHPTLRKFSTGLFFFTRVKSSRRPHWCDSLSHIVYNKTLL